MFTLKDYYTQVNLKIKSLDFLLGRKKFDPNQDRFFFPILPVFLGARICYSSKHPISVLKFEYNYNRVRNLLVKLAHAGHYSVFAHSPIMDNPLRSPQNIYRTLYMQTQQIKCIYKVFSSDKYNSTIINLRHIVEHFDCNFIDNILSEEYFKIDMEILKNVNFGLIRYNYKNDYIEKKIFTDMHHIIENSNKIEFMDVVELVKNNQVEVMLIDYSSYTEPFGWMICIIHGCSVIFTHQLVRHTFFNFNQRSYRYTSALKYSAPITYYTEKHCNHKCKPLFEQMNKIINNYKDLYNIPPEDIRYVLPWGQATSIMFSGCYFMFQDYINKRTTDSVQPETKNITTLIRMLMEEVNGRRKLQCQ